MSRCCERLHRIYNNASQGNNEADYGHSFLKKGRRRRHLKHGYWRNLVKKKKLQANIPDKYRDKYRGKNLNKNHSVQFSLSVMSDSLQPHQLQHARLLCPTPGACSNSCPSSWWCHPTISSSVVPFSCLQPFPASGSFPLSQFFTSGGQSIGVSASASVLPMNIQHWFP